MTNISKDFVTKNGLIVRGSNIVTGLTSQTNALQIDGGAAIAKNLIVGSTATINGNLNVDSSATIAGNLTVDGVLYATVAGSITTASNIAGGTAGQLVYQIAAGQTGFVGPGTGNQVLTSNGVSGPIYATKVLAKSGAGDLTTASGQSLVVSGGGLGVIGDSHFANNVRVDGNFFVSGGTTFEGNVTFSGTATYVYSTNTFYTDNIVNIHTPPGGVLNTWTSNDGKDIGVVFHNFLDGYDNDAFLGYHNESGYLEWFDKGSEVSTGTFVHTRYGTFKTGAALLDNSTGVHNATSGALQVKGGVGVGGGMYVSGVVTATSFVGTFSGSASAANAVNGGTAGQLLYQSAPGVTAFTGPGTSGEVLTSNGTSGPVYVSTATLYVYRSTMADSASGGSGQVATELQTANASYYLTFVDSNNAAATPETVYTTSTVTINPGTGVIKAHTFVGTATTATNIAGGTAGRFPYQTAPGVTAFVGPGTAGEVLTSNGTAGPTYVSTTTLYVYRAVTADSASGTSNVANNLTGGALGQIPYQLAANSTAFIGTGTNGSLLQMGANTATFVATASIYVNRSVFADNLFGGAAGGISYQTGANATTFLSIGTAGQVLTVNAGATAPQWTNTASFYSGSAVSSQNLFGGTAGQVPYQTAPGATSFYGPGSAGQILVSAGTSAPVYTNTSSIYVDSAVNAQRLFGGTAGQLVYQSNVGTTAFAGPGTAGQILLSNGTSGPVYTNTASVYVDSSVNSERLFGGTAGQLVYQSGVGTTAFAGPGTAGQILVSAGASAPVYTNTSSIYVNRATIADTLSNTGSIYVNSAVNAQTLTGGTAGQLVYQSAPGVTAFAGPGTAGQILVSNGTSAPVYTNTASIYVNRAVTADSTPTATSANNLAGGTLGQIPYQLAAGSTAFIGTGTTGSLLQMGANTATFVATASIYVNRAVLADNLSGGAAGGVSYQTAANASTFLSIGTVGQILTVNAGATAPQWTSTSSIYASAATNAVNLFGGTGGSLPYQSAANTTAMLGIGASNSILVSNGSTPSWTINPTIGGNVTIVGNLTVQGSTVIVDSTVTNISDPILTLGTSANNTMPVTDDGKDRGIAFVWTGTQAGLNTGRTGFFGFDRSSLYFTFITSATITNEVVAAAGGTTRGALDANLAGGTAGQLVYQSAADTTAFVGPGTSGQILVSAGTSAPAYTNTASIHVGLATTATTLLASNTSSIYVNSAVYAEEIRGGTAGQLLYQVAANDTGFVGPGTAGQLLVSAGATAPVYTNTSSIYVGFANQSNHLLGGAAGGIHYQTGAGASTFLSIGTAGQVLTVNAGATAPQWSNTSTFYAGFANQSNHILGGTAGQLVYQTGAGATSFVGPGTAGQILVSNGASAPVYTNTASIYVNNAFFADEIRGGTAGQLVYQSAANTTDFVGPGTAGQILVSNGTSAPVYTNTSSIYVNRAVFADSASGNAGTVSTVAQTANLTYFLTFVDANNATAAAEAVYTTSTIVVNPSNSFTGIGTGSPGYLVDMQRSANGITSAALLNSNAGTSAATRFLLGNSANADRAGIQLQGGSYTAGGLFFQDGLYIYSKGAGGNTISAEGANPVRLATNGTTRIQIDSNGRVGFSNSSPASTIDVTGDVRISGITTVTNTTSATSTVTGAFQVVGGIGVQSNVSIGGALVVGAGDTNQMGVRGEIRATNEITAYYSDRRLKENVQVIGDALLKVLSLHGITYTANDVAATYGFDKTKKLVGVFADEIEAVLPEAVRPAPFDIGENGTSMSGQNFRTVQYEKIVPLLIEAIKEQQTNIEKLAAELKELKDKLQ